MPPRKKQVSAFKAKQVRDNALSRKASKSKPKEDKVQAQKSDKKINVKSKSKAITPKTNVSKRVEAESYLLYTEEKLKGRRKRRSKRNTNSSTGNNQSDNNQVVESIEISDSDDDCFIIKESIEVYTEGNGHQGNIVDSDVETKDQVGKKKRRRKRKRNGGIDKEEQLSNKASDVDFETGNKKRKSDDSPITVEEQDYTGPSKNRRKLRGINDSSNKSKPIVKKTKLDRGRKKRNDGLDDTNDNVKPTVKKSKLDTDQKKQNDGLDESSGWETVGSRSATESVDEDQLNELDTDDSKLTGNLAAIPVDDSVLVLARHPCTFPLKGRVRIQALVGVASIMGYHLVPGKESCDVFSPDCNSLVTVSTVSGKSNVEKSVKKIVSYMGISNDQCIQKLTSTLETLEQHVILKFDYLETNLCSFISNFNPYTKTFRVTDKKSKFNKQLHPLEVEVPNDTEVPSLNVTEDLQSVMNEWKDILEKPCKDQPVILVCGGKNSGKSTTNRLLINSSLNVLECVYYLECDIGQSEFTPCGVVSLVAVTSPVLGPPFTHQRKPLCSYHFGGVSPKDNPDLYMKCVQLCVDTYRELQNPGPLVVNTMGWLKGLGWQLLLDTVHLVSPSVIVQLTSNQNSQNISPITVGDLSGTSWTEYSKNSKAYEGATIKRNTEWVPKIIHLGKSLITEYNFKIKSVEYRNLSILSHLGDNLETGLTLTSVTPYMVNWKDVAIHMCNVQVPKTQIMYALNASLVALCEGDISMAEVYMDDGPLFLQSNKPLNWLGYGIVRGIDMEKKRFYVITSLSEEELARVNVLDVGGVTIPENFLISQKCEKLLYADAIVVSEGLSAVKPRKHMPRRTRN